MAYTVSINGQSVFVASTTLQGDRAIGQRSTASFAVHTSNTSTFFVDRSQVQIHDEGGTLVFSGYLDLPKWQQPGWQASLDHILTCIDQHWLADKRVVGAVYTNMSVAQIAQAIWSNFLQPEGVTIGQIYDPNNPPVVSTSTLCNTTLLVQASSATIPSAVFAYCKVSEALDKLVEVASESGIPYYWHIDEQKQLWLVPYTYNVVAGTVDGTAIDAGPSSGLIPYVQDGNPLYRNTQYGTGGVNQTVPQTKTGIGDGTGNVTMDYDLYSLSAFYINGAAQTIGTKGQSGFAVYWAVGDPVIAQDSAARKLTAADTWEAIYVGQYPNVNVVTNNAQISYMASVDGSSGIVEEVDNDTTITSAGAGMIKESALLTRYGVQGQLFVFKTLDNSFAPGQLRTFNYGPLRLNSVQMLIEAVTFDDSQDGLTVWYQVSAVAGPYDTTWPLFFSKLLTNAAPLDAISVGSNSNVTLLQQFSATLAPTATLTATAYACPIVGASTFCGTGVIIC